MALAAVELSVPVPVPEPVPEPVPVPVPVVAVEPVPFVTACSSVPGMWLLALPAVALSVPLPVELPEPRPADSVGNLSVGVAPDAAEPVPAKSHGVNELDCKSTE